MPARTSTAKYTFLTDSRRFIQVARASSTARLRAAKSGVSCRPAAGSGCGAASVSVPGRAWPRRPAGAATKEKRQ